MKISELRDSQGTAIGVSAYFNGHGYHCHEVDCLHRDPLGVGSEYTFKQGTWFETKFWKEAKWVAVKQPNEVTDAALVRELNAVNEKLRPYIQSLKANEGGEAMLVPN